MKLSISFHALFPLLNLLQAGIFFTLFVLRGRREERHADFWLAALLLALGLNGVPFMLGWLGYYGLWEDFTFLPWDGLWLLVPPLMYLFLKSLINTDWRFAWRIDGKHLVLYLIYFTYHLVIGGYGLLGNKTFARWWWDQVDSSWYISDFFTLATVVQQGFYLWFSLRLFRNYQRWAVGQFSDTESVSYKWFRTTLIISMLSVLVNYCMILVIEFKGVDYANMWWGYLADGVLIYYLSISALMQARVRGGVHFASAATPDLAATTTIAAEEQTLPTTDINEVQKPKNTIPEAEIARWVNRIEVYFNNDKPYLQPDLTLSDVAAKLKTNTSILSQVINTGFGKNFNDFVNEFRVATFKTKIGTPEVKHLTLLAIAFECGFNSKATFNRAVKKITGQNPSDF